MELNLDIRNEEDLVVAILTNQLETLEWIMREAKEDADQRAWELNKKDWKRTRKALIRAINYNVSPDNEIKE